MTKDFVQDLVDCCEQEQEPYMIVTRSNGGYNIRVNVANSKEICKDFIEATEFVVSDIMEKLDDE